MRSPRQDGLRRRDELLDAAVECFVRKGVLATGIEDVRKAAGASPSSVYHQFAGMPDLTAAVLTRTFERLITHLCAHVLPTSTAQSAVHTLVESHLDWFAAHRDEAQVLYQTMALELTTPTRTQLATIKATLKQPLLSHLAQFSAAGTLPSWPPHTLELVLLGPTHEACRQLLAGAPLDLTWLRTTLPHLAWRAVAP